LAKMKGSSHIGARLAAAVLAFPILIAPARAGDVAPAAAESTDLLQFANGDVLHGTVLACDKIGLRVQSPYAASSTVFRTADLLAIHFRPRQALAEASKAAWNVLLVNGDEFPGSLVSIDDKTLLLDTWYAGRLSIPRGMVAAVGKAGFPYLGPSGLDGWVLTPADGPGWSYAGGAFSTVRVSAIGRPIRFPAFSHSV
jgi:hypothetical protein